MKRARITSRVLVIALVAVLIGAMLPLGALANHDEVDASSVMPSNSANHHTAQWMDGNTIQHGSMSLTGDGGGLHWQPRASMPTPRSWTDAVVHDGKIYVVGGCSCLSGCAQFSNAVNTVEVYDPVSDTWQVLASMPNARVGPAAAVVDGKIYVMGGFNRAIWWSANPSMVIYDIATNTWSTGKSMPTGRSWARAVVLDGKIYVLGGVGYNYFNVVERYDPQTDTWTSCAPFSGGRYLHAAVAANGKIYVIGGDTWQGGPNVVYSDIQEYDPLTNSWTTRSPMPSAGTGLDAVAANNRIWVFGSWVSASGVCRIYDPASDQWTEVSSDHDPAPSFSLEYVGGFIYRFGGGGWGPTSHIVEAVDIGQPTSGILLIPSEEDSYPAWGVSLDMIHILALNVTESIDEEEGFDARVASITSQGGLAIVAHPAAPRRNNFWKTIAENRDVTAVEIWNAQTEEEAKSEWYGFKGLTWSGEYLVEWDEITHHRAGTGGRPVWGIAVDDAHKMDEIGRTWVMVRAAKLKDRDVLNALQNGSFYAVKGPVSVSEVIKDIRVSPDGQTISVEMNDAIDCAYQARFVRGFGKKTTYRDIPEKLETYTYKVQEDDRWVRVEISFATAWKAWTQPFMCKDGKVVQDTNPYKTAGSWYKAQLHCHTTRSDGALTPDQVKQKYEEYGYDILAITDHNRITIVGKERHMYVKVDGFVRWGPRLYAKVTVKGDDIKKDSSPRDYSVKDVLVTGYWKDTGVSESQRTFSLRYRDDGVALFGRWSVPVGSATYTFVVEKIEKEGWTWDPDDDRNVLEVTESFGRGGRR